MKSRNPLLVFVAMAVVFVCGSAHAHDLDVSTARVTLRDGHVEVLAELDMLSMLSMSDPHHASLEALASAPESDIVERLNAARNALETQASVEADGDAVPMVLRKLPTPSAVRTAAATASNGASGHRPMVEVRLESTRPVLSAKLLTVKLPASVGPVLYTFTQPEVSLASSGSAASFPVLTSPTSGTTSVPVDAAATAFPWISIIAGVFAAIAIAVQGLPLLARARRKRAPGNRPWFEAASSSAKAEGWRPQHESVR